MMNPRIQAFCSLLVVALLAGCVSQREKTVYRHIDGILASPSAVSNEWSVLITDPNGRVRYQKNPTRPSVPASNEKLFTVSGAFGLLGANHSFETRIYLDGQLADGVLKGDVNLVCEHDVTWNPDVFPTNAVAALQHVAGGWLSGTAKVNTNALSMQDGSALSRENACSAAQLISLLRYMMDNYPAFASALPIACTDGTLAQRFCGTAAAGKVHAKTGTLRVCAVLSGYVEDANGAPRYLFSFIANNRRSIDSTSTRQIIDEAVTELAPGH